MENFAIVFPIFQIFELHTVCGIESVMIKTDWTHTFAAAATTAANVVVIVTSRFFGLRPWHLLRLNQIEQISKEIIKSTTECFERPQSDMSAIRYRHKALHVANAFHSRKNSLFKSNRIDAHCIEFFRLLLLLRVHLHVRYIFLSTLNLNWSNQSRHEICFCAAKWEVKRICEKKDREWNGKRNTNHTDSLWQMTHF